MESKRTLHPLLIVCLVLLAAGVAASIALSALALSNSQALLRMMEKSFPEVDTATREDDVTIAGQYVIRPTRAISDAYKTGDTSGLDDKQRETLDMAAAVLAEIITDGMSPFEREKAVYEWMTTNLQQDRGLLTVIPSTRADCDNPYGVLKYHNAVCVGYAVTFRMFMEMLDIPCMVVHSTEMYHSWDLVQLDGDWYHTDIYADAGVGNYRCFNLSDAMLSARGSEWDTGYFPAATSLKYNMASRNSIPGGDIYEFPVLFREALEQRKSLLAIRYGLDLTEHQARVLEGMADQLQSTLYGLEAYTDISFNHSFTRAGDGYLFVISFYGMEDQEERLTMEEREKIDETIRKVFGDLMGWSSEEDLWGP